MSGLSFEREIAQSSRDIPGLFLWKVPVSRNDRGVPVRGAPVDFVGCLCGRYIALEAKASSRDSMPLSHLRQSQWDELQRVASCGGLALVAFRLKISRSPRVFVVSILDLVRLKEDNMKTVSVRAIEEYAVELPRAGRQGSLILWNLSALKSFLKVIPAGVYHSPPL